MENSQSPDNGKTVAIISYITIFGWILAFILHRGNKPGWAPITSGRPWD